MLSAKFAYCKVSKANFRILVFSGVGRILGTAPIPFSLYRKGNAVERHFLSRKTDSILLLPEIPTTEDPAPVSEELSQSYPLTSASKLLSFAVLSRSKPSEFIRLLF